MEETIMQINQQQVNNIIGHKCLSSWEQGFIESVSDQMKRGRSLSSNQERIVSRCLEKTTPEKVIAHKEWAVEYNSKYIVTAILCARYYKKEGYFTHICNKILDDENFIPSIENYKKMCENKYALKVVANSQTPFNFGLGNLARVRRTVNQNNITSVDNGIITVNKLWDEIVVIIDNLDPIEFPALYKTVCCSLLTNPSIRFWVEERKLKKFKKSK